MPDNSFEKDLSRQMEGFTFPASEAVWHKLEENLLQRKKRRRAIFWFFSGMLLISAGIYFYVRPVSPRMDMGGVSKKLQTNLSENKKLIQDESSAGKVVESNKVEYKFQTGQEEVLDKDDITGIKTDGNNFDKNESVLKGGIKEIKMRESSLIISQQDKQVKSQKNLEKSNANIYQTENKKVSSVNEETAKENKQNIDEEVTKEDLPSFTNDIATNKNKMSHDRAASDSISVSKISQQQINLDSLSQLKNAVEKHPQDRGLQFGIRFEAGISGNSESNISQTKSADMASGPITSGPVVYSYPYIQDPSFAWSFGAFIRKPLSKKTNLQTGLVYHHYRTSTPVGPERQGSFQGSSGQRDMIYSPYYQQGDDTEYKNNYHLLSVPIELNLQLNKGEKFPISWQFGIEPGWIIGSDAIFKDTSGYLYSDKDRINRFQIGIQTGINFRFFLKQKHPMEMGPVFQYMLTPSFKEGSGYEGHLHFFGLRADWVLFNSGLKQRK